MITQLYVSGNLGRDEDLTPVAANVRWATELCSALNVTGLSLYSDGDFINILEGSAEATLAVVEGFRNDSRMVNVKTVLQEVKPTREFTQYNIGLRGVDYSDQVAQTFRLTSESLSKILPEQPSVSLRVLTNNFAKVHNMPIT